jgi:hypothetical protein
MVLLHSMLEYITENLDSLADTKLMNIKAAIKGDK